MVLKVIETYVSKCFYTNKYNNSIIIMCIFLKNVLIVACYMFYPITDTMVSISLLLSHGNLVVGYGLEVMLYVMVNA